MDEAENGSAIRNDWLLAIHQIHMKVQNEPKPKPGG